MTDVADLRAIIQQEESNFKFAVSQSWAYKLAGAVNFINNRQHQEKRFDLNGPYNIGTEYPYTQIDGMTFFYKDATVVDCFMFIRDVGSSGTTELDVKWAAQGSGVWASIFSTTPKIDSSAGSDTSIHLGQTGAGLTPAVFSKTSFSAGDRIRMDLIAAQAGSTVFGTGLVLIYRPR